MKSYAGTLAAQLLKRADIVDEEERMVAKQTILELESTSSSEADSESIDDTTLDEDDVIKGVTYVSPLGRRFEGCTIIQAITDGNGNNHSMAKFPVVQTGQNMKKRARVQPCADCSKETTLFCVECNKPFCHSFSSHGHKRKCFYDHIPTCSCDRLSSTAL